MITYPNAKINIGLNVVEKRADGFHNIESIFYPVFDVHDILEVIESDENNIEFSSTGIEIPGDIELNLCLKAYHLLKEDFPIPSVKIHLHKMIPIGAGLGGGSSDAAFMLLSLNDIFDLGLTTSQLIDYARKLGSDCAFFIENRPVYAFNKGDEFEQIELDLSDYDVWVDCPEIHIGTGEAYAGIVANTSKTNLMELIKTPISNWRNKIKNDFENSIFPNYPQIAALKEEMYKNGAIYAAMTGSGSAVYGIFNK